MHMMVYCVMLVIILFCYQHKTIITVPTSSQKALNDYLYFVLLMIELACSLLISFFYLPLEHLFLLVGVL